MSQAPWARTLLSRVAYDYGMVAVLALLCVYYSWVTLSLQYPDGASGGRQLAAQIAAAKTTGPVLIVVGDTPDDAVLADVLVERLHAAGHPETMVVKGQPSDARKELEKSSAAGIRWEFVACNQVTSGWPVFEGADKRFSCMTGAKVVSPGAYRWPNFLKTNNLLNIANQIAVIAIIAIGMTIVVISGGIDLSVGSLIALSAVVTALIIRDFGGGAQASTMAMVGACAAGIISCALLGLVSGAMITCFAIPPFIATLAMMLVASGLAFILAHGQSIYQVPDSFIWLGRGATAGVPNGVLLMVILYLLAHLLMTRTVLGRYLYAVGGNPEAARLSAVPVRTVLLFAYALCACFAGVGGIVMASQLKSGAPTYGQMYELYVIAAVVVGGASLSGGEGQVLATLVGALIIAVIQNGMNLTNVESYTQKVVLGLVLLGAVLLDMLKRRRLRRA